MTPKAIIPNITPSIGISENQPKITDRVRTRYSRPFMTHSLLPWNKRSLWDSVKLRIVSRFVDAHLSGLTFLVRIVSEISQRLIPRRNCSAPYITWSSSPSPIFNDYSLAFSGGLSAQIPMVSSIRIHGTPLATSKSFESQWKFAFLAVLHKFLGYCLEGELSTGLPWLARARKDTAQCGAISLQTSFNLAVAGLRGPLLYAPRLMVRTLVQVSPWMPHYCAAIQGKLEQRLIRGGLAFRMAAVVARTFNNKPSQSGRQAPLIVGFCR